MTHYWEGRDPYGPARDDGFCGRCNRRATHQVGRWFGGPRLEGWWCEDCARQVADEAADELHVELHARLREPTPAEASAAAMALEQALAPLLVRALRNPIADLSRQAEGLLEPYRAKYGGHSAAGRILGRILGQEGWCWEHRSMSGPPTYSGPGRVPDWARPGLGHVPELGEVERGR